MLSFASLFLLDVQAVVPKASQRVAMRRIDSVECCKQRAASVSDGTHSVMIVDTSSFPYSTFLQMFLRALVRRAT